MTDNNEKNTNKTAATNTNGAAQSLPAKKVKPPKIEDKPFDEFINLHLIPTLSTSLSKYGIQPQYLKLTEGERPVVGGQCSILSGCIEGKRFWLCFSKKSITSQKTISIAEKGSEPSLVESFLIDEKKITLALLVSRILQRLNGQKWLGSN